MAKQITGKHVYKWKEKGKVDKLLEALKSRDVYIREKAALALGEIGDTIAVLDLLDTLTDRNDFVRKAAAKALMMFGEKAEEPIFEFIKTSGEFALIAIAPVMDSIGPSATSKIANLLDDSNPRARAGSAFILGELNYTEATGKLSQLSNDENHLVRIAAATSLGKLGDVSVVPGLIAIANDENPIVRERVALSLGELGDNRALPALQNALNDGVIEVRIAAAIALGKIGDTNAIPSLSRILNDMNKDSKGKPVASFAIKALGQIGSEDAFKALIPYLKVDSLLRDTIAAFSEIGDARAATQILNAAGKSDGQTRMEATKTLQQLGLNDKYPEILSQSTLVCPECETSITANLYLILYAIALIGDGETIVGSTSCTYCKNDVAFQRWYDVNHK